jgi:hypothetical protein
MSDKAKVLNTATGQTGNLPRKFLTHPFFNKGNAVIEVTPETKPFVTKLYKPQTAEQFEAKHPEKVVSKKAEKQETPVINDADSEELSEEVID